MNFNNKPFFLFHPKNDINIYLSQMSLSNFKPMRLIHDTSCKIKNYATMDEKTLIVHPV